MEHTLHPPKPLSFEGNVAENWRRWIQQFHLYMTTTGGDKKEENVQCSLLLSVAGEDALEVFNTFNFTWSEKNKFAPLVQKFEEYCIPRKNVTYERHLFNTRNQGPTESIDSYVTALKNLAKSCEFGELTDSLIRDRIVCGIQSVEIRPRLLRERALEICRSAEISIAQLKNLVQESAEINAINTSTKRNPQRRRGAERLFDCGRCGKRHETGKCPAYGQTCGKCNRPNHFANMCRARQPQTSQGTGHQSVHMVEECSDYSDEEFFVGAITKENEGVKEWMIESKVNGTSTILKLDTGAQCNVMPNSLFSVLSNAKITISKTKLLSYSGHSIRVIGSGKARY